MVLDKGPDFSLYLTLCYRYIRFFIVSDALLPFISAELDSLFSQFIYLFKAYNICTCRSSESPAVRAIDKIGIVEFSSVYLQHVGITNRITVGLTVPAPLGELHVINVLIVISSSQWSIFNILYGKPWAEDCTSGVHILLEISLNYWSSTKKPHATLGLY